LDLLASWIVPDRTNLVTLSTSLAGSSQVADQLANQLELTSELDSLMEFGLKSAAERILKNSIWQS